MTVELNTRSTENSNQAGFTVLELLVSLSIGTLLFGIVFSLYSAAARSSHDQNVRLNTFVQAQSIVQTIGNELRMIGNGVPFDQVNFRIGSILLTDPTVSEPIQVATATANSITFRLNETGHVALLIADFDPGSTLTLVVTDASGFGVNDQVYISNSVVSGEDGLYGIIESIDTGANTVTLAAAPVYSPAATFAMGSLFEASPLVAIQSGVDGITRDSGFGAVSLGQSATMELEYLDPQGTVLDLPLTNDVVINQLRAIRVSIEVTSATNLRSGEPYVAQVTQTFALRNLNYVY